MLGVLENFRRKRARRQAAERLYDGLMQWARDPDFYRHHGVPDTVDGRFDMVVLHVALLLRRLRCGGEAGKLLSQAVFDVMVLDFDRGLRELGVGDQGVSPRVKKMIKAYYGRVTAYEAALDGPQPAVDLGQALVRNLFRKTQPQDHQVAAVVRYALALAQRLETASDASYAAGNLPA